MRKFGQTTIQRIIKRAFDEFTQNESSPDILTFRFEGRSIDAVFQWSTLFHTWYLSHFDIYYPRCVIRYSVSKDYDIHSALLSFEK